MRSKKSRVDGEQEESTGDYSELSKGLHRFALDGEFIARLSFERERRLYLNPGQNEPASQDPVWVCGLARAGTTIITDLLYETGAFASLTYRHMPLPLAPRQWRRLCRLGVGGAEKEVERAHGDGMMVNIDSPEALEEVFWRVHEPKIYEDQVRLRSHSPQPDTLEALSDYLELIIRDANRSSNTPVRRRYLSKNNNHLMRFEDFFSTSPKRK